MERRTFFRLVLGSALMPISAKAVSRPRSVLLQESPLAGFQFYEGESVWHQLAPGEALRLAREPDNAYDQRAVAVYFGQGKLGYVPRRENVTVAQMLDRGERLTARVTRLRQAQSPWQRVQLEVLFDVDRT